MNDQPSPFDPAPLPAATPEPAKTEQPKRRATGKRPGRPPRKASTPTPVTVAPAPPKRRGRPVAGPKTKVPVTMKLDFGTALAVASGLKPEDTELFGQIAVALQKVSRKGRGRIAAALARMFQ